MTDYRRFQHYQRQRTRPRWTRFVRLLVGFVVIGGIIYFVRGSGGSKDQELTIEGAASDESASDAPAETPQPSEQVNASAAPIQFDLAKCTGPLSRGLRSNEASLTFNAVSASGRMAEILTILKDKGAAADFFVTGKWVEAHPDLFKEVRAAGFGIHNFGYSHSTFTEMEAPAIQEELEKTDNAFATNGGGSSKPFWRPPFGSVNDAVTDEVKKYGYCPVLWTVDAYDWEAGMAAENAKARVLEKIGGGGIAVMQTSNALVPEFLGALIDELRAKGLTLVPLATLFGPAS